MSFGSPARKVPVLHVLSLPHTQTTVEYDVCAFTAKVRKFCDMMASLGKPVILYAGDENDADCKELVTCITREEQFKLNITGPQDVNSPQAAFNWEMEHWRTFNARAIAGLFARAEPGDFICVMGGLCHKLVTDAFPQCAAVEFGIGYPGSYAPYRVFESYAWMHSTYAKEAVQRDGDIGAMRGRFYDTVIPSYFEPEAFPEGDGSGDYLFFIGRLTGLKGLAVVRDIAERTELPLVVAGLGDQSLIPQGADYRGLVGPAERAQLFANARCTLVPTLYVEPFGSVASESLMCGTPVVCTDWGAMVETVRPGLDGFRCHDLGEFAWAVRHGVQQLDRAGIRKRAMARFSMDVVRHQYARYFSNLETIAEEGWYTRAERPPLVTGDEAHWMRRFI